MELGLWRTESGGGEGAVTEERVSDFGNLSWEWTCGPSSRDDGGNALHCRLCAAYGLRCRLCAATVNDAADALPL